MGLFGESRSERARRERRERWAREDRLRAVEAELARREALERLEASAARVREEQAAAKAKRDAETARRRELDRPRLRVLASRGLALWANETGASLVTAKASDLDLEAIRDALRRATRQLIEPDPTWEEIGLEPDEPEYDEGVDLVREAGGVAEARELLAETLALLQTDLAAKEIAELEKYRGQVARAAYGRAAKAAKRKRATA